jgi:Mg-chelatase subunit ChlD
MICWQWLTEHHFPQVDENAKHLPFYGRWEDLVQFFTATDYQSCAMELIANQLKLDKSLYDQALALQDNPEEARKLIGQISLCAKWAPTEGCTYDKQASKAKCQAPSTTITQFLYPDGCRPSENLKDYRTEYLTPLRGALNIVERLLCAKKYDDVDFSKVPSVALKIYSAKCFPTHMADRFAEWQRQVMKGRAKANVRQVDPYEVVRLYLDGEVTEAQKPTLEAFYKLQLEEFKRKYGSSCLGSTVCVVDTSGSMAGTPMAVAVSLGVWISGLADPMWNLIYTFNSEPCAVPLTHCETLESRITEIKKADWGGNTNLQATFKLILSRAQEHALTDEQMPRRLVIISDMQFDQACSDSTNLEAIRAQYRAAGYTMPQIVFWNVNAKSGADAAPARDDERGITMISGFSKNLIPILINGLSIPTPYDMMLHILSAERYDRMTYVKSPTGWRSGPTTRWDEPPTGWDEPPPLESV